MVGKETMVEVFGEEGNVPPFPFHHKIRIKHLWNSSNTYFISVGCSVVMSSADKLPTH